MATAAELLFPKLVVFGATGPTGQSLVEQALQRGYYVTAVARNPAAMDINHERFDVVRGNIFEVESLEPLLEGKNAVLCCLGVHGSSVFNPTKLYSTSMQVITDAMKKNGIDRLVCITSWGTESVPGSPKIMEWFLKPLIMSGFIKDMLAMEKHLESSDLNYTIVRPPGLTKGNARYKAAEGQFLDGTKWFIPRADVAHFMLKTLETHEWDKKGVAVGSEP